MKKYPFSNKAMKAMLAASIALSPFAASALSAPVKVEASETSVNDAVSRLTKIYSELEKVNGAEENFRKAKEELNKWEPSFWETLLPENNKVESSLGQGKAGEIAKAMASIAYSSNATSLNSNIIAFKGMYDSQLDSALGLTNTSDIILRFLVDAEKKLWDIDNIDILFDSASIYETTINIKNQLINDPNNSEYKELNDKLKLKFGFGVEGLFYTKDRINSELESKGVNVKKLRNAFILAALKAKPDTGTEIPPVTNPDGGGAGGGGAGGGAITPPAGSTTVVEKGNKVVTEIPAAKVQEIVNLLTEKNNVIPVKLGKVSGDKKAVAEVPANLFTEAGKKNSKAVVAIETEAAVYKLPVSEINVADLAKKLGVSASDVKISISVNVVSANVKNKVADVVEFQILAVAGDKQQAVTAFSTYVDRVIRGAKEFSKGNSVAVRVNDNGTLTAIPTIFDGKNATVKSLTNSKYTVVENNISFKDVTDKSWAKGYIETLANKLIVKGKAADQYAPADHMTRAEFTVLLVRALGLPAEKYDGSFKDVKGTEWFNENGEIMAAVKHGIIKGINSKEFAPQAKITRAEAAVMIERAMNLSFVNYDKSQLDSKKTVADFKDAGKLQDWNKKAIEAVYQADIVSGRATKEFDPKGYTQRDEMAKILANFLTSAKLIN